MDATWMDATWMEVSVTDPGRRDLDPVPPRSEHQTNVATGGGTVFGVMGGDIVFHHDGPGPRPAGAGVAAPPDGRIRILMLAANPDTTSRLALDEEAREITEKLRLSQERDTFELITRWAVRPADLLQHLNQFRPQIVHFSGHGSATGEIALSAGATGEHRVSTEALARLFQTMKDDIQVVVLNACYSTVQAQAISQHIDHIIGMRASVDDRAAIVFAAAFYSALGFNRTVREAFDQAVTALMLHGLPDDAIPELIVRPGAEITGPTREPGPVPAATEPLFTPLPAPVRVTWLADLDRSRHPNVPGDPTLEIHVVPVGAPPRPARVHAAMVDSLPDRIRAAGTAPATEALSVERDTAGAAVVFEAPRGRWDEPRTPQLRGIRLRVDGQVSVWATLPGDILGAVLDGEHLPAQIAGMLRLIGRLGLVDAGHVAVAAGVQSTMMLSIDRVDRLPRQRASMVSLSERPLRVEPDERISAEALAARAAEVAAPLARAILDAAAARR